MELLVLLVLLVLLLHACDGTVSCMQSVQGGVVATAAQCTCVRHRYATLIGLLLWCE